MTARHLKEYLQEKAAEDLELATVAVYPLSPSTPPLTPPLTPPSTELVPGHAQPRRKHEDPATGTLKLMNMWDFREYMFALDNLEENLAPALPYSWKWLAASALAKTIQFHFWSSPQHQAVGWAFTALTVYHASFTVAYHWFLHLITRCRLHSEQLNHKVGEVLRQRGTHRVDGVEDLCEDDLRAWGGLKFRVVSRVARHRGRRNNFHRRGWSLLDAYVSWLTL
ncbi:hypothetical protein F5144DRAFT_598388 [Chaetomium tenue]|uniref:Uncharacterized protein n=1 Tax=Chaetomium tenue TaxID=1854479 RepID=A0ACB7PP31_9PEZI|nr:hypothetical protein F5144DRAFT_598388 [Chaetomium globosum]